jgi:ABC-type nitrate/sulfonate/bicarbonate transport system substrate-binding protein
MTQAPSRMIAALAALGCALAMQAQPAHAADKVVAGSLGGQAPLWGIYIAVHKGFFAAENIDLELNFAQSGPAVIQQLTAGSLDVALSVGITTPMHAIDKGAPLALIRIIGNSAPYALIGKPGLKTLADLKGKTIATGQVSDITTVYFERMMAAHGLKDLPFTGMAIYRRWAAANMPVAKRILAATDKSHAWFANAANRNEAIELLVKHARSSKEDAEESYDYLRRIEYFEPHSKMSRAKLQNLIDTERSQGNVTTTLTIDRLAMPGLTELAD